MLLFAEINHFSKNVVWQNHTHKQTYIHRHFSIPRTHLVTHITKFCIQRHTVFCVPAPHACKSGHPSTILLHRLPQLLFPSHMVGVHTHLSKHFKFQILLDQIKFPSAYKLAKFIYVKDSYMSALAALRTRYGQPRQLVQWDQQHPVHPTHQNGWWCCRLHLTILNDSRTQGQGQDASNILMIQSPCDEAVYLDLPNCSPRVLLKVLKVTLHAESRSLETFALLDDASSRTIILSAAGHNLHL